MSSVIDSGELEEDDATDATLYLFHNNNEDREEIFSSLSHLLPLEADEEEEEEERCFYVLADGLVAEEMLSMMRRVSCCLAGASIDHDAAHVQFLLHHSVPVPHMRLYLDQEASLRSLASCAADFSWAIMPARAVKALEYDISSFFTLSVNHRGEGLLCPSWRGVVDALDGDAEQLDYREWEGASFVIFSCDVMRSYNDFFLKALESLPRGAELELCYWMEKSSAYTEISLEAAAIQNIHAKGLSIRLDVRHACVMNPHMPSRLSRLVEQLLHDAAFCARLRGEA